MRQIITPADAVPHDYDELFDKGWRHAVGREDIGVGYFTAAECAQIARNYWRLQKVYGRVIVKISKARFFGNKSMFDKYFDLYCKIVNRMQEYEAKFSEWEKQT